MTEQTTTDTTTTTTASPWYGADAGDDIKGFVELKGWDAPTKAIASYRELEQFVGADKAGRGVVWPKDETDVEGWKAINAKLGVPETPDAYKLPVPEGGSADFAKAIAPVMHKLGLSAKQAEGLAQYVNQFEAEQASRFETESKARAEQEIAKFKADLGAAYGPTVELGKRAAKTFGVTDEQFSALEESLGLKGTVELFAAIGKKLGEDTFVGDGTLVGGDVSPQAASVRLEQLRNDREWVAKVLAGDVKAIEEKERLEANQLGMSLAAYRSALTGKAA